MAKDGLGFEYSVTGGKAKRASGRAERVSFFETSLGTKGMEFG